MSIANALGLTNEQFSKIRNGQVDLADFAELISGKELFDYQKKVLKAAEKAYSEKLNLKETEQKSRKHGKAYKSGKKENRNNNFGTIYIDEFIEN